jgi:hypothetical protein
VKLDLMRGAVAMGRLRPTRRGRRAALMLAGLCLVVPFSVNAAVVQSGNLRVFLSSQVQPYKLPRIGTSPIAVFVAGRVAATSGGVPAQLEKLSVKVNRHARFQSQGLPVCPVAAIQPATTQRALRACGPAVIGSGQFWAQIVLPEQGAYATQGRLLIFNGRRDGKQVLLAHIYTSHPFATSFVLTFGIHHIHSGPYGTEFSTSLPEALGEWGFVNRIKLTLKRKYIYHGKHLSYFNAGCPAQAGVPRASYPLAYATFSFAGEKSIGLRQDKTCGVKE